MNALLWLGIALLALVAGGFVGYLWRRRQEAAEAGGARREAERLIAEARSERENLLREAAIEAKEEAHRLRAQAEEEVREARAQLQRQERRMQQREEGLDRKEEQLARREAQLRQEEQELAGRRAEAEELVERQRSELERIAGLTREEARRTLMEQVRQETFHEVAVMVREMEEKARREAEKEAREVIAMAIQRCAADHVAETSVSVVHLPGDEMKGRIIGREGRNIRTFEQLAGVDLIIDDTPEAVVVSAFDPIRREKARLALELLVADGRIHPARIEEMYQKAEREVEQRIREEGEQAMYEARVHNLHPELVRILGRLRFRTSYGQNVLKHSIEVSHLAAMMAQMLGGDVTVARRAGLLHDVGKAVDHEMDGTHLTIGMELLRKYNEPESVVHAMSCHHGDFEPQTMEAVLVTAADALSAARPGARRESLERYIERLEKLEEIANSFEGVERAFAIQAGREIRILVKPDRVGDAEAYLIAKEIGKRIENELQYPGQIKVTVIRETRAVEYAR